MFPASHRRRCHPAVFFISVIMITLSNLTGFTKQPMTEVLSRAV